MGRETMNREKEPFLQAPQPVRYGDFTGVVAYQDQTDIVTAKLTRQREEEESRVGRTVEGEADGANRVKDLPDGFQLRRFPPYHFWRAYRDGELLPLGDWNDLQKIEQALEAYRKENQ